MSEGREMPDGSLVFPHRGKPPVFNDPRYEEDPEDAYRYVLKYVPCDKRVLNQKYTCNSGRSRCRDFCILLHLPINPKFCSECQRRNDPVHPKHEGQSGATPSTG